MAHRVNIVYFLAALYWNIIAELTYEYNDTLFPLKLKIISSPDNGARI